MLRLVINSLRHPGANGADADADDADDDETFSKVQQHEAGLRQSRTH